MLVFCATIGAGVVMIRRGRECEFLQAQSVKFNHFSQAVEIGDLRRLLPKNPRKITDFTSDQKVGQISQLWPKIGNSN